MKIIYNYVSRWCLLTIFLFLFAQHLKAQTTLAAGDIAFTGYIGNGAVAGNDAFAFVVLKALSSNTVINFTDRAWLRTNSTTGVFSTVNLEGIVTFTATSAIAAGTEVTITITGTNTATVSLTNSSTATATGTTMPALSANGDQVLAYQGTIASPVFISAIHMNVYNMGIAAEPITNTANWEGVYETANSCGLPTGLTNGTTAIWIPGAATAAEVDNAKFNCGGTLTTVAGINTACNAVANWATSDGAPSFTLPTNCMFLAAPAAPSFTTNTVANTACAGLAADFNIVATGTSNTYQWQEAATFAFTSPTNLTTGGIYTITTTATTATLAISDNTTTNGKYYRCVATNVGGSTNSNIVLLTATANTLPTVNTTLSLTMGNSNNLFVNAACRAIAKLAPNGANPISGNVDASAFVDGTQATNYLKRHYEIMPTTGAATATSKVTLFFTQQEFTDFNVLNALKLPIDAADAANNKANLLIEKRPGTSSDGSGNPLTYTGTAVTINPIDADIIWNVSFSRWEVSFNVTGFSGFFVKTFSGTLNIQWLQISAAVSNNNAVINFKVQENNIASYVVETSQNGVAFNILGSINAQGNGIKNYSYTQVNVPTQTWYYRVKQIALNGNISYSPMVVLGAKQFDIVQVYPIPANDMVNIFVKDVWLNNVYSIVDLQGKLVKKIRLNQGLNTVNIGNLKMGTYILQTNIGRAYKIIKQ